MRNSVILIDQIDQDRASGIDPFEAVVGAAVRRFRPIMLTAAAAVLALIPIAQSLFWGPLAYAMMGGIMVATVLTVWSCPPPMRCSSGCAGVPRRRRAGAGPRGQLTCPSRGLTPCRPSEGDAQRAASAAWARRFAACPRYIRRALT